MSRLRVADCQSGSRARCLGYDRGFVCWKCVILCCSAYYKRLRGGQQALKQCDWIGIGLSIPQQVGWSPASFRLRLL